MFVWGQFVIYTSCAEVILPLRLNYINICIDMFVYNIKVFALIFLHMLYNISISCISSWGVCSLPLLCTVYSTTAVFLHLCLNQYVFG